MAEWITERELCEWLSINSTTAWRWRKEGMPYIGKKKSIRYNQLEVEEWLRNRSNEQ
ncbi:MAG: helix-turn-helix domain-containing protein [Xylanivirga thermophila]|jgi:predicted site-specific integrase-resolvase|uniref:helix-turn-helix domain-containing protein n=1 Tax=Xylanivirga thermophila TaxID=2496273 RepID=UPI00101D5117|nr:helix-turn-helix domain-containing protein [Xylanivirga thermophila]